jgi:uncharacterized membrane protein
MDKTHAGPANVRTETTQTQAETVQTEAALRRAKRPRSILAGPYGHPLHAVAITIPIGAWTAAVVFDLISLFVEDPEPFAFGATWLVGIGLVGGMAAAILGLIDFASLERGTTARRVAVFHMVANIAAMALFAGSLAGRLLDDTSGVAVVGVALCFVGYAVVGLSGFLGGELAYRYGVRVADEETQRRGYRSSNASSRA